MSDDRDRELRELIALAAVGALDRGERAMLDAEIAGREDLLAELAELEAVAATFADATAETPPAQVAGQCAGRHRRCGAAPGARRRARPVLPTPHHPRPRRRCLRRPRSSGSLIAAGVGPRWLRPPPSWPWWRAGSWHPIVIGDDDALVDVAAVIDDETAVVMPLDGTISSIQLVHSPTHRAAALVGEDVPALDRRSGVRAVAHHRWHTAAAGHLPAPRRRHGRDADARHGHARRRRPS